MLRRTLSLVLALLCLLALPRAARAMDQCEDAAASMVEIDPGYTLDESEDCAIDPDDPSTVPLCMLEAASAIAPPTVHGIGDARIEAPKQACSDGIMADGVQAPGEKAPQHRQDKAPDAALTPQAVLSPLAPLSTHEPLRARSIARRGHHAGVYRPPRG